MIWARIIYAGQYAVGPTDVQGDVYIQMFDTLTNLTVNGDGRIVNYTITDLSGSSINDISVQGQTVLIYSGLISDSSIPYNLIVTVNSVSDPGSTDSTPCDLDIDQVQIDSPETVSGAEDGQVTILAVSSSGPVEFSLNGVDWQDSNIFTGLASGVYMAYARSPVDCTDEFPFFVPLNSDLLISTPAVQVGENISRWNAVFNPIVFKYQRKDFSIISITNLNGYVYVTLNGDTSEVEYGDLVYVNSGDYDFTARVIGYDGINSLELERAYVSATSGEGFINIDRLRKYYEVETVISFINLETSEITQNTSFNTPDGKGLVDANLQALLGSALSTNDLSNYDQINFRDMSLSASYTISFREKWSGYTGEFVDLETPFYVTFAARQLGQMYGGNMFEFVPFIEPLRAAKFLTDFEEPQYSEGWPFDISFIYSEWLLGQDVKAYVQYLDINRSPIGATVNTFLLNEDASFLLNQDSSRFIITTEATTVNGQLLPQHLGINRILINNTTPANCYYLKIWLQVGNDDITERKIVRVDQNCEDGNSMYMRWIGSLGEWEYFRFTYNANISMDVQNMTMYKSFVDDWANDRSIEKVINKNAGKKVTLVVEDMPKELIEGLQSIKHTCEVQMLYQLNPLKWHTVVLNTAIFEEFETRYDAYPFGITFNLPSINTNSQ